MSIITDYILYEYNMSIITDYILYEYNMSIITDYILKGAPCNLSTRKAYILVWY